MLDTVINDRYFMSMKNDKIEEWLKTHDVIDKDSQPIKKEKKKSRDKRYDMVIDLHGLHMKAAEQTVKSNLKRAYNLHYDKVLLIHGIGLHSSEGPVLKDRIRHIVKMSLYVRDFTVAPPRDGGDGAIVVYIRKK